MSKDNRSIFWLVKDFSVKMKNYFRQIQAFEPDYASVAISQFESERTGMRVVVVQREGPKIEGKFILATEIHDDSGARKFL